MVALVRMEKVRASQILPLRKRLKGEVVFVSVKDRVAGKAFAAVSDVPGLAKAMGRLTGQCMLAFTDMSPFKLNVLLAKNRVMLPARAGDIADMDVVVPAKNTGIAPGPMLTEFKEAGIPTKIDQGTIWITKDTVPVKKGEPVGERLAPLLGKLDIKPVEAGISLESALEDGEGYGREDLAVDVEAAREGLAAAHLEALSLSVEAAYAVPENAALLLAAAARRAEALAVESAFMTAETGGRVIAAAGARARGLAAAAAGYSPGED